MARTGGIQGSDGVNGKAYTPRAPLSENDDKKVQFAHHRLVSELQNKIKNGKALNLRPVSQSLPTKGIHSHSVKQVPPNASLQASTQAKGINAHSRSGPADVHIYQIPSSKPNNQIPARLSQDPQPPGTTPHYFKNSQEYALPHTAKKVPQSSDLQQPLKLDFLEESGGAASAPDLPEENIYEPIPGLLNKSSDVEAQEARVNKPSLKLETPRSKAKRLWAWVRKKLLSRKNSGKYVVTPEVSRLAQNKQIKTEAVLPRKHDEHIYESVTRQPKTESLPKATPAASHYDVPRSAKPKLETSTVELPKQLAKALKSGEAKAQKFDKKFTEFEQVLDVYTSKGSYAQEEFKLKEGSSNAGREARGRGYAAFNDHTSQRAELRAVSVKVDAELEKLQELHASLISQLATVSAEPTGWLLESQQKLLQLQEYKIALAGHLADVDFAQLGGSLDQQASRILKSSHQLKDAVEVIRSKYS